MKYGFWFRRKDKAFRQNEALTAAADAAVASSFGLATTVINLFDRCHCTMKCTSTFFCFAAFRFQNIVERAALKTCFL